MPVDLEHDAVVPLLRGRAPVTVVHLGAGLARHIEKRSVELRAPSDHGVLAGAPRQRERGLATGRRPDHHVVDGLPRRHGGGVESQRLEQAQRADREAVAADLVPGKGGPVHDHDVTATSGEGDGGGGSGGSAPHHHDIGGSHSGVR